jgi:1-acyl-sn-glycerol-3-phosphate acyltransferase
MHLASLVEDMRCNGAQAAVVRFRGVRRHATSYAEVAELAGWFAAELERRGIGPGERVVVTLNHPFHVGRGTLGKPLPGRAVKLSDEGEILVRGDTVSTATWRDSRVETRAGEWLATGDLATADESGALRFAGRRSETIVGANGLNVYPADMEAELLRQPGVRAAAVVGCEGASGQEAVAVLVCKGDDAALQQVLAAANGVLADFQRMRRALRWPEPGLPYTSTGKLMRRQVAAWACGQPAARTEGLSASAGGDGGRGDGLAGCGRIRRARSGQPGARAVEAALEERFGLELDEDAMAGVRTLEELRRLVGSAGWRECGVLSASVEMTGVGAEAVEGVGATSAKVRAPEHWYPRWTWWRPVQWGRVVFQEVAMRAVVAGLAAPRVERSEVVPPQPLLIVANHVTSYDVPLVLYGLPSELRRRVAVAMAGEMLMDYLRGRGAVARWLDPLMPVVYWLITLLFNVFPLPRLGGFRRSFEHAGAALDAGYSVLIFLEGRRSADGRMGGFRSGIGLLVQQADAAVLPVALAGIGELKQRGAGVVSVGARGGAVGRADAIRRGAECGGDHRRAGASCGCVAGELRQRSGGFRGGAVLPVCPDEPDERDDDDGFDADLEAVEDFLEAGVRIPLHAELHADVGQGKAPRPGADKGVDMEAQLVHLRNARRERDEGADDGQHAAEQHGERAEPGKEAVSEIDVVAVEQDVAAVALDHRAATFGAEIVGGNGAEVGG